MAKPQPKKQSFLALAEEVDENVVYPKLDFGDDKNAEVSYDLEAIEAFPRDIQFPDKFAPKDTWVVGEDGKKEPPLADGFVLNVKNLATGNNHAILMRGDMNHGLTKGIAQLVKSFGGDITGKRFRVFTRNYKHKEFGKTRGYTVQPMDSPEAP